MILLKLLALYLLKHAQHLWLRPKKVCCILRIRKIRFACHNCYLTKKAAEFIWSFFSFSMLRLLYIKKNYTIFSVILIYSNGCGFWLDGVHPKWICLHSSCSLREAAEGVTLLEHLEWSRCRWIGWRTLRAFRCFIRNCVSNKTIFINETKRNYSVQMLKLFCCRV